MSISFIFPLFLYKNRLYSLPVFSFLSRWNELLYKYLYRLNATFYKILSAEKARFSGGLFIFYITWLLFNTT